jgi:nitrile hydratase
LVSRTSADGARLVARAWVDEDFKLRLLADAREAALELGLDPGPSPVVVAVENTEQVHHLVVCTLCSCYPRALLGPPPAWYKSLAYRSRAVSDPRGVVREFGLELDPEVELRVLDSTADIRYLVLPRRPSGTGEMSEAELAGLVTRDSMIGVANPVMPAAVNA